MIKILDDIETFCKDKDFCLLGNASSMLMKEKDLDKFGVIGRMNRGDPRGKEKFIGSRTDILFLSTRMEGETIQRTFDPKFVVWMTVDSWLATKWVRQNAILNPWKDWCELYLKIGAKPTTGAMAINFIFRHIWFKSLTIYGFDFFATPTWYNRSMGYHNAHDGQKDKEAILEMIADKPNVRLINEA